MKLLEHIPACVWVLDSLEFYTGGNGQKSDMFYMELNAFWQV